MVFFLFCKHHSSLHDSRVTQFSYQRMNALKHTSTWKLYLFFAFEVETDGTEWADWLLAHHLQSPLMSVLHPKPMEEKTSNLKDTLMHVPSHLRL